MEVLARGSSRYQARSTTEGEGTVRAGTRSLEVAGTFLAEKVVAASHRGVGGRRRRDVQIQNNS
ncbi:hypothetical protein SFRURICE_008819 [Spodoptera frugiperda]|nr:hypothetical protein SFRURICE_008819 [Spodoptera frugiperda]